MRKLICALIMALSSSSDAALACGYTDKDHDSIWQVRLLAARFADEKSSNECAWEPESPLTFADDLVVETDVADAALFQMVAQLIRRDQNALAMQRALHGSGASGELTQERLEAVNRDNLSALKLYFEQNKFPGVSDIGEGGIHALLLLVAHADADVEFQRSILIKMNDQVADGNLPAYFPLILKSIRSQVGGAASDNRAEASIPSSPATFETPRQCYYATRSRMIEEYLRDHYRIAGESGSGDALRGDSSP